MNIIKRFTNEVEEYENEISPYLKVIKSLPLPYAGNKRKMLSSIYTAIKKHDIEFDSVLDAFSGSGAVSLLFKSMGKRVLPNDILTSSFVNSVALIGSPIKMSNEEQEYLLHHNNSKRKTFVEDNYLGYQYRDGKSGKYNKFTLKECHFLDNFRANIDDLSSFRLQCLGLAANAAVVQRLPFGNIDASYNVINHRVKQKNIYGSGGSKHDRRIGIYYDSEMNLNFSKWFKKYINDFTSIGFGEEMKEKTAHRSFLENATRYRTDSVLNSCRKTNIDVIDLLNSPLSDNVDCIYFDPPYGGQSSDYATMYKFLEEFIYSESFEDLPHYNKARTFVGKKSYEDVFIKMLNSSKKIPIWIFSYNDTSWKDIDYITSIIRQQNRSVIIETLTDEYKYLYRKNRGKSIKGSEYLIFAC
jgi:adenine-specific DNA methylase